MKKISVFSGEGTELTGKDHYGMQSYCGEKGCSVHVDNETPCQGCVNGKVTVLRSILSGKTYVSCHGDAEFECQANDGGIGTEWNGDVVNVANDLEMGREERTFGDVIKESNDLEIDGKEMTLGDVVKEVNDLEIEGGEKTLDDVMKEANDLEIGGEEMNLGDAVKEVNNLEMDGEERTLGDDANIAYDQVQDGERDSTSGDCVEFAETKCKEVVGRTTYAKADWDWCSNTVDCGCTVTCKIGPHKGEKCVGTCGTKCCRDTRATYTRRITSMDQCPTFPWCHNNADIWSADHLCCPNCKRSNCKDCPNTDRKGCQ